MTNQDPFGAIQTLETAVGSRRIFSLPALTGQQGVGDLDVMPYSIKILLECCLRHLDGEIVSKEDVLNVAGYDATNVKPVEIPYMPTRVLLQDFTGVPAVVDLAAMRDAVVSLTGDDASAQKVNPLVPCDLIIDHSVQVDAFNSGMALTINSDKEFERNRERYELLKWAQTAFDNFHVVPPATGICHQVNLEYLGKIIWDDGHDFFPDSLVGTDSHTTMINGLSVMGWGVGGIEAEAVMVGQPIYMLIPEVVGFRFTGQLAEGTTATDLVLRVTEMLREHGVVGKFVEYFGPGLAEIPLANRATIANMSPEYGATMGFFPTDEQTLKYLSFTGRDENHCKAVEQYCKAQGLWHLPDASVRYSSTLELDLSTIEPALAGPKRPQDRITLADMKTTWQQARSETFGHQGPPVGGSVRGWSDESGGTAVAEKAELAQVEYEGEKFTLADGAVVIAAITSCTNTSNPDVMIGAGLLARKAAARGLTRAPWVKTSLAPGSKVVTQYLEKGNLLDDLEHLGFYLVGYGCTTCIGNSGPLPEPISQAVNEHDLVACSVLSGNRNFEGRISPDCKANYLASPPLVVAYAIAGTVDIDLTEEPIGQDQSGEDVYLRDIWPSQTEVEDLKAQCLTREQFVEQYSNVFDGSEEWQAIEVTGGNRFAWSDESTYIHNPPFFAGMTMDVSPIEPIHGARVLCKLGTSVTTDHISPAGAISPDSPAGQWLTEHGVERSMFNSFGSRRGNDLIMTRGTFGNIRVRNQMAPGTEGGLTTDLLDGKVKSIFEASCHYKEEGIPLVVLADEDYGMGSSRDWAAKGTMLLGVRVVIAQSFERIHRSNLIGMGVVPLCFKEGQSADSIGLDGSETFDVEIDDDVKPRQDIKVTATKTDGTQIEFNTTCRLDTPVEVTYYRNGGILQTVLRRMASS